MLSLYLVKFDQPAERIKWMIQSFKSLTIYKLESSIVVSAEIVRSSAFSWSSFVNN
jgi:hypothetical protein